LAAPYREAPLVVPGEGRPIDRCCTERRFGDAPSGPVAANARLYECGAAYSRRLEGTSERSGANLLVDMHQDGIVWALEVRSESRYLLWVPVTGHDVCQWPALGPDVGDRGLQLRRY
jgi:hypothetical protein